MEKSLAVKYVSSILNCSIGNILEWYDFGLFTIFTTLFGKLFFPQDHPKTALIATVGIFSIGFLCRPIGALIFGYLGDKKGRAFTLRLSILMIVLPTLIIGFLPTFQQVGILAPILLTLVRIWQGISIGGEYGGSLIYLAETAPAKKRARFTAFASMGANFGILLAELVGVSVIHFISNDSLEAWGWRIPYIVSGILCVIIYKYRLRIHETDVFHDLQTHHHLATNPIQTVFTENLPQLLRTVGLVCMGSTFYFFTFYCTPTYMKQPTTFPIELIFLMIITIPIAAWLCDIFGRRKMMLFNASLIILTVIPGFYFIELNNTYLAMAALTWFTLVTAFEQGATPITVIENFPARTRYTGVSLGYNIGNGLLGGTVPLICNSLMLYTNLPLSPAIYIAFCACITAAVVYWFIPKPTALSSFSHPKYTH